MRLAWSLTLLLAATAHAGRAHKRHPRRPRPAVQRPVAEPVRAPAPPPAVAPIAPPAPAPPAPPAPPDAAATLAQPAPSPRPAGTLELAAIELDGGVGARSLAFGPGALPGQRDHLAPAVALLGFRASLHPFARSARPFLSGLGATVGLLSSVAHRSAIAGATAELDGTWLSFDAGVHDRVRLGRHPRSPWIGVALAWGRLAWAFERDGRLVGDLPSVDYRFVRPSLDLRLPLGPVQLALAAGYRAILQAGYLAERFGTEVRHGVDASAALTVALPRAFAVGARGDYAQVFHPNAVDRFASGTLFFAWMPR